MTRRWVLILACLVTLSGIGISIAGIVTQQQASIGTVPVVATAAVAQLGGLVQQGPSWQDQFGNPISTIHITVGGIPGSGTYVAYEAPVPAGLIIDPTTKKQVRDTRAWGIELHNPAGVWMCASAIRYEAGDGSVKWTGSAAVTSINANSGASSGFNGQPNSIVLAGADFNGTGTSPFVGNPAYGGGGNVTITVSP